MEVYHRGGKKFFVRELSQEIPTIKLKSTQEVNSIFAVKYNVEGAIDKYKASFVVKNFLQVEGRDFLKSTLRLLKFHLLN